MSKRPLVAMMLRVTSDERQWVNKQAARSQRSASEYMRQAVLGERTRWGLPPVLWAELEQTLGEQGLSLSEYLSELVRREMTGRLEQKQRAGVGRERRRGVQGAPA